MDTRTILEIFGWLGSGCVVFSLVVAQQRRFRRWNFIGSVIATIYNIILGIWPFAAMNGIIALIDAYWLHRLANESRTREEGSAESHAEIASS